MPKCLSTLTMLTIFVGQGVQTTFADDPSETKEVSQRQDGQNREFEVAIKRLTAQLKELTQAANELKKAKKLDRLDLTQKKMKETVEKLESLKSRYRKSQDRPRREVRRVKERRREGEPRRERARNQRTEVDGAIEEMRAKYNALKKKAEDLAKTDKRDAQELVRRQMREVGGALERLMADRNRRLASRREGGERRERQRPRREGERRERERGEGERRKKDGGPMTELNNAIKKVTGQYNELKQYAEKLADENKEDALEKVKRQLREVGGHLERLHGQRNRLRRGEGERRERDRPRRERERGERERREGERGEGQRRERDRGNQTELNNAIEKATAKHHQLELQAEKLADSDNKDALARVKAQLRESGGYLERLHGMKNRQREGQGNRREGQRREGQRRERRREGERREEHPEIRAAVNRLEHMQVAIGHLKEAGLKELAQAAGQRAEKLQAVIARSRKAMAEKREAANRREREEKEGGRERERDEKEGRRNRERDREVDVRDETENREDRSDSDAAMREIGQAVRELSKQLNEIREDVNNLKKKLDNKK